MKNKPKVALFNFGYLINVPPFKQEMVADSDDILLKWTSLGWQTMPGAGHLDNTAAGGFFCVPGFTLCIEDMVYMHRFLNIEAPGAADWLERHPWNYDRSLVGWVHTIIFRNGWKLVTASEHDFSDLWTPTIAGTRMAVMENAIVNLDQVVKVTGFKTNLTDYVKYLAPVED